MPAPTRVTDGTVGICDIGAPCCAHGRAGTNTQGSEDVEINDLPVHRLTDDGNCNCPHGGTYDSTTGSADVEVNDLPITRVDDITTCQSCGMTGRHVTGSPDVEIN